MSHLLEDMAFVGATPWHGLGNQLPPKQPLEVWASKAGMDWSIRETPVCYRTNGIDHDHGVLSFEEQKVIYRSDSGAALSVVSDKYKAVQPREVLEFYRDLTDVFGYQLETAGVLSRTRTHREIEASERIQLLVRSSVESTGNRFNRSLQRQEIAVKTASNLAHWSRLGST